MRKLVSTHGRMKTVGRSVEWEENEGVKRDESKREEKAKPVQPARLVRNNGQVVNKFEASKT